MPEFESAEKEAKREQSRLRTALNSGCPPELIGDRNQLLDSRQVAGFMGISVTAVRQMVRNGGVTVVRISPGVTRFRICDIDEAIAKRTWRAKVWRSDAWDLPATVACKLLDTTASELTALLENGKLANLSPYAIRTYLRQRRPVGHSSPAARCTRALAACRTRTKKLRKEKNLLQRQLNALLKFRESFKFCAACGVYIPRREVVFR